MDRVSWRVPCSPFSSPPISPSRSYPDKPGSFLVSSAKITEILHVFTTSTPASFLITILYRHSSFHAFSIFHSPTPLPC